MPLETATYIPDLVATNPAHSDALSAADAHMRLIKSVLQAQFAGVGRQALVSTQGLILPTDGTSSLPGLAFNSEAALGFYRVGAGEMGIAGRLIGQGAIPIGAIIDYAGTAAIPAGFLACDGQSLSTTTYAELFAAIGYTWGGSGTSFNVPNFQYRFRRHRDNSTISGAVGNLQAPVNISHTHAVSGTTLNETVGHTHTFSGTTGSMNQNASHSHGGVAASSPYSANTGLSSSTPPGYVNGFGGTTNATNTDHQHTFSGTTSDVSTVHQHAFSTTSAAAGDANEARPYSATVFTLIRAL